MGREDLASKPENIREKIVDGRIGKRLKELSLMDQPFIKDQNITVEELIKQSVATLGENIQVRRFSRFTLGEGIEKKEENFAEEVAAQTGQKKDEKPSEEAPKAEQVNDQADKPTAAPQAEPAEVKEAKPATAPKTAKKKSKKKKK
jgi:elongation factor Ts